MHRCSLLGQQQYWSASERSTYGVSHTLVAVINHDIRQLVEECVKFLREVYPYFLRVAEVGWRETGKKKDTLERLRNVASNLI